MKRQWNYLTNVFLNVTKGSYVKMLTIISDHESKLRAKATDPDIAILLGRTEPIKNELAAHYNTWTSAKGIREGETLRFENLLKELSSEKIPRWDAMARVEYLETTPDYKAIFPDGRTNFRQGSYESRIAKVGALAETLAPYTALSQLKTEVETFYQSLISARDTQQQKEQLAGSSSAKLDQARIASGEIMYANLGFLMNKYYTVPETIEDFFELKNIQSQKTKEGSIPYIITVFANSTQEAGIKFDENTEFHFNNTGDASLFVYTGPDPETPFPEDAQAIEPGGEKAFLAGKLGDPVNRYLFVTNKDPETDGEIEVLVLV